MKKYLPIILYSLLILCSLLGQHFTLAGAENFMQKNAYLYYTNQSNLLVMAVAAVMLFFEARKLKGLKIPVWAFWLEYVAATAIALTFVVFSLMLTPEMIMSGKTSYLYSPSNLFVHNVVPILMIVCWCLFGSADGMNPRMFPICIIPAFMYTAFVYIRVALNLRFGFSPVPYFFFDYQKNGWFSIGKNGIGVVWWMLLLIAAVMGMGYGLMSIVRHREKKISNV